MMLSDLMKGKTIKFLDITQGFERYGKIVGTTRIKMLRVKKADGTLIKSPTVKGFKVKIANGKIYKIKPDDILSVRWYGKDISLKDFVANRL